MRHRYIAALVVLPLTALWLLWVAPYFQSIDKDFSYSADIVSLDNFYDEERETYQGQQLSITTFSFDLIKIENGVADIRNTFAVRTPDGNPIFAVDRLYSIDPQTGEHVSTSGDRERSGYLFGPRGEARDYTYWHVNYDQPLHMIYQETVDLYGLPVHRYAADFVADQTDNLSHLPVVPDERGVELDVHLETWIEPTTGYLVQYEDHATAWYYSQQTHERLHPWNSFHNRYSRKSLQEHVYSAQEAKDKLFLYYKMVPLVLILCAIMFLCWSRRPTRYVCAGSIVLTILCAGICTLLLYSRTHQYTEEMSIGIALWDKNDAYDRNIEGFRDGLERSLQQTMSTVQYSIEDAHGDPDAFQQIITSFVDDDVDLIYTITTPGTLIAQQYAEDIPVIFSIVTYPQQAGIVQSLQRSGTNAVGTRNWIPSEDQLALFLEIVPTIQSIGFVHRIDEPNSSIQLQEMSAAAVLRSIDIVDIAVASTEALLDELEAVHGSIDALYAACDTLIQTGGEDIIIDYAREYALPDFTCLESGITKGSLFGLVTDFYEIGSMAGEKAVQVLSGIPPAVLETHTGYRNHFLLNASRTEELGILIPPFVLSEADSIFR